MNSHDIVRIKNNISCPCCGAPIVNDRCDYCGKIFVDIACVKSGEPFLLKVMRPDGKISIAEVILKKSEIVRESPQMLWADNQPIIATVGSAELHLVFEVVT